MSEKLLEALLQLFALVAKVDGVKVEERQVIKDFLKEQINADEAELYIKIFDEYAGKDIKTSDTTKTLKICNQVNQEMTQQQKIVIIYRLLELILADKVISASENDFILTVASSFNIEEALFNDMKSFVVEDDLRNLNQANLIIIDGIKKNPDNSQKHIYEAYFPGQMGVFRIPELEMYIAKYLGDKELYLNGIPLKNNRIYNFPTGSNIRSGKTQPIYYSDVVSVFLKDQHTSHISYEARDVQYTFPGGKIGLQDINIREVSGKLIGIMGASGSGKSTLMNVLNGTAEPSDGIILINGIDLYKEEHKTEGMIGFVPQDDLLIEDLTVYQNLYYAAKLCFKDYNDKQIDELVLSTLGRLGLQETKDLKVGSPLKKTISGGQRKRLNIGLELLREPSILFVDEPTSGLSSRDSENIMDLLKELSLRGKLIFVVIHQPSSDIFKMFDRLFILDVGGYPVYYGNPVEGVVYFKKQTNQINSDQGECSECGNVNPEQIFNILETRIVDEYGKITNKRKLSPEKWYDIYQENIDLPEIEHYDEKPEGTLKKPNVFSQWWIFLTRDFLSKISNTQYLAINLLEAPFLAFLLAYIVRYYTQSETNEFGYLFGKNVNIPAYIFMAVIVALFMGLTVSAEEIIRDRKILKREVFLKLSRASYLFSKTALLFSLSAIQTVFFVFIGNYILGIQGLSYEYWLVLFTVSCFANMLGLNISSAFNSAVTVYILIPILLIPQLMLGGVLVKFDEINPNLTALDKVPLFGEVMASRWAFEALSVNQFKNNEFEKDFYLYDRVIADSEFKTSFLIPELKNKADYTLQFLSSKDPDVQEKLSYNVRLIKNEIEKLLKNYDKLEFPEIERLDADYIQRDALEDVIDYLDYLNLYFSKVNQNAMSEKDKIVAEMTKTEEDEKAFRMKQYLYHNDQLQKLVTNSTSLVRFVETEEQIIQEVNPIYKRPNIPDSPISFRTHFYAPEKYFMGKFYNTLPFNVVVIWVMTILLFVLLYFDVLRKLVDYFGNLSKYR
ncbi:MAG: ATP-binding cassette domain-containing protein [Cytophagales bacterium]